MSFVFEKKEIICLLFFLSALSSFCQNRIYGSVIDIFTGEPIDSCQTMLYDSDTVRIVATTVGKGGFNISGLSSGEYVLMLSARNYYPEYQKVKVSFINYRKTAQSLGTFKLRKLPMSMREHQLEDVVIKTTKVKMFYRGDTIVYNADAFQLAHGSMLDDLVRQLPGVELRNGQIFVNGEFVDNLMVNGRDFFKGNPRIALENLPGYMVNNIKIYRRESDKNTALGIESMTRRDKELVMDVNLKKVYSFGWSLNGDGGVGTDNHYSGKLFGLRFSNYSRSVVFGNVNNTNNASVPGSGGDWKTQYDLVSPSRYYSAGFMHLIDDRRKRFKYEGNVIFDQSNQNVHNYISATQFLSGGDTYSRFRSQSRLRSSHLKTTHKLTLQKPGSKVYVEILPTLDYTGSRDFGSSMFLDMSGNPAEQYRGAALDSIFVSGNTTFYQQKLVTNTQRVERRNNGHTLHADLSANATIRLYAFDELNLRMKAGLTDGKMKSDEVNNVRYYHADESLSDNYKRMYAETPTNTYNYSFGADYSLKFVYSKSRLFITPKYEISKVSDKSPRNMYTAGDEFEELFQQRDVVNSYHSKEETVHHSPMLGVSWQYDLSGQLKFQTNIGMNQDFQRRRLAYQRNMIDTVLIRNDEVFSPNVSLTLDNAQKGEYYSLNYIVSHQFPSLTSALPYVDDVNPLLVMKGNPQLKKVTIHDIQFLWNRNNWMKRTMLSFSALYSQKRNALMNSVLYDRLTGVTTLTQCNTNGNYELSAILRYYGLNPIPKIPVKLDGYTSVSTTKSREFVNGIQSSRHNQLSQRLSLGYDRGGFLLSLFGVVSYQHVKTSAAGSEPVCGWDFSYGLKGGINLPWNVRLSGDMTMYGRRAYSDPSMNTDKLVLNLQIGSSFMKDRVQFRLVGYDLFGNIDNVFQTVNSYGRKETWRNVITRYVMVSLSYRFNKKPKKK